MKVFIFCPIGGRTGGPEAIHQLCDKLRQLGINCFLLASATYGPRVEQYEIYNAPLASLLEVSNNDIIVTPESYLRLPKELENHPKSKIYVWWLSVDNCNHQLVRKYLLLSQVPLNPAWNKLSAKSFIKKQVKAARKSLILVRDYWQSREFRRNSFSLDLNEVRHLAQSAYAIDFINKMIKKDALMVSDYVKLPLNIQNSQKFDEKVIVYNHAKGGDLVSKVATLTNGVKFVPLRNMTYSEVIQNISSASLYLDLGHFPGKDRLPREAILNGTPVIISERGSGKYSEDFDIPQLYKFDLFKNDPYICANLIMSFISQRDNLLLNQKQFRSQVIAQEEVFTREVKEFTELISL